MFETAIFAAGCFWGVQDAFDSAKGVVRTTAGYCGGSVKNPSYELVCTGLTGHAESVKVEYDSSKTSFKKLLELFFTIHDPTTLDRQGPDVGRQYRSAVFSQSQAQEKEAKDFIAAFEGEKRFGGKKITTEVVSGAQFFAAEDYHQHYYAQHKGPKVC